MAGMVPYPNTSLAKHVQLRVQLTERNLALFDLLLDNEHHVALFTVEIYAFNGIPPELPIQLRIPRESLLVHLYFQAWLYQQFRNAMQRNNARCRQFEK